MIYSEVIAIDGIRIRIGANLDTDRLFFVVVTIINSCSYLALKIDLSSWKLRRR